jgi:predicted metal-dependent HD superfamily phosphohydrolase
MPNPEIETGCDSLEMITHTLADQAFKVIEAKYGPNGQNPKSYHNVEHSRDDVVGSLNALADLAIARGRISSRDKALLIIGGAFHDIEQDLGSGLNEAASTRVAHAAMRTVDIFTPLDEAIVEQVIMSTVVRFENGIMLQSAPKGNLLAELMADADLSPLGRDAQTYWDRSARVFTELSGHESTTENQVAFLENQIRLLQNHRFYTPEANELFPHQEENLEYTKAVLTSLVR